MRPLTEQVRYRSREMQRIEAREGRSIDAILRDLYIDQGLLLAQVGDKLGITESTASRWLAHFGIETRKSGAAA